MTLDRKEQAQTVMRLLAGTYPGAGTKLHYTSTFALLIAVVLSAQSTDEQVNRVTRELFEQYQTAADFAALTREELEERIKSVGLYKTKARHIIQLARMICHDYGGEVPSSLEELVKLPGVGRKSANVMLSVGFNRPGLGVDTHVQRVANRLGLVREKYPDNTERELKKLLPPGYWTQMHHLLIVHGRTVCQAKKPGCRTCPVLEFCDRVGLVEALP